MSNCPTNLWDYFAALALPGLLADYSTNRHSDGEIAKRCWSLADAMLAERQQAIARRQGKKDE